MIHKVQASYKKASPGRLEPELTRHYLPEQLFSLNSI
jgi:hypothetical protein